MDLPPRPPSDPAPSEGSPWGPPPPEWRPAPQRAHRGLVVLLAALVAAVVVVATVLVVVVVGEDDSQPTADPRGGETSGPDGPTDEPDEPDEPEFRNWLEPAKPVKIGRFRYVSPCQALSYDDVEDIYGGVDDGDNLFEETYDVTQRNTGPNSFTSFFPRCDYDGVVRLETEQYTSIESMRVFGIAGAIYADDDAQQITAKLRRYRQAAALTDDESVTTFVEEVSKAGRAFAEYDRSSSRRLFRGLTFEDVVAPVGGAFDMGFIHDNVVYTLGPQDLGADELARMSDEEVLEGLEMAAAGVERVREHITDPALSQAPGPTFPHDDVTFGETTLLEPCAVLTPEVFRQITGRPANSILRRYHPSIDMQALGSSGSEISGYHDCERNGVIEGEGLSSTEVTVNFDIRYAGSAAELAEGLRLEDFRPLARRDTRLRTKADWAAQVLDGDYPFYKFTVGNYFLGVQVQGTASEGTLTGDIDIADLDRAAHIRAINKLVPALKRHLRQVERSYTGN